MILENFIVFEGIDGAGTTTQLNILKKKCGSNFLFTAEPSRSPVGKFLRSMLGGNVPVTNETATYLFAADRNEHLNADISFSEDGILCGGIKKACGQGKCVVCDRYIFSSLAYQSIDCSPSVPRMLNSLFPLPELLFYFDIDAKTALSRVDSRGSREIYEKLEFLEKTVIEYRKAIDEYRGEKGSGMKIVDIDATLPVEKISEIIWTNIADLPIMKA